MMTENTQCIASALRNSILNLGVIPKVVYQDNGRAFKSKFFQSCDFDEDGFNGVYANLNIHSVLEIFIVVLIRKKTVLFKKYYSFQR